MSELAKDECQIVLALGRKLAPWDLVVSFFDAPSNRWIARRCDINLHAVGRSRDLALQQVKDGRRLGKRGRPVEEKIRYETRLDQLTLSYLDELAEHTGVTKSGLISLLITKAYAAWKNMSLADDAAKRYNDQQRLYLIGGVEANIPGLISSTDIQLINLLMTEEEAEARFDEAFQPNYPERLTFSELEDEQRESCLLIDCIAKKINPAKVSVRFHLDCSDCGYQSLVSKVPSKAIDRLTACNGHRTFMTIHSIYRPTSQRIRHCYECGLITGPLEHPFYATCEEHIAAGITENYFK